MPNRRKAIREAAIGLSVGRWVDTIDRVLDSHVDQGRPTDAEAQEVLRDVLEALARQDLGDKVVFMETGTFPTGTAEPKAEDEWPTELPKAARSGEVARKLADEEDEILAAEDAVLLSYDNPVYADDPAYSGPIRLPEDLVPPERQQTKRSKRSVEDLKRELEEMDSEDDDEPS